MSRYRQYSYELPAPRSGQDKIYTFNAEAFVKPDEFLSVVNQYGKAKLHAVVDTTTEKVEKKILIIGTGQSIPDDLINRISKIGTLNFGDGQFGYHYYLVQEESVDFYKKIVISKRRDADEFDFEGLRISVVQFAANYSAYIEIFEESEVDSEEDDYVTIKLKHKESKFEQTPEFKDFILNLYSSDLADVTATSI